MLPKIERVNPGASQGTTSGENPTQVASVMRKMEVVNAEEREALCNDGTPAAYYFRPATQEHVNDWVVFLHGGGACGSDSTCADRAKESPRYVSSGNHPETIRQEGIFSSSASENPDFYNWNHVEIIYCSSDLWVGDATGTVNGEDWEFRGKNIVQAVIEDLQKDDVLETAVLNPGDRLLLSGSSAGGGGVTNNLDRVAALLPGVEVKGFIDSSFGFDIEPYEEPEEMLGITPENLLGFQNLKADESCVADHAADKTYCSNLDNIYPYIETPVFVFNNQFDRNRLNNYGINKSNDSAQTNWVQNVYHPAFLEAIADVNPLFSPTETFHTMLTNERFFTTEIDGVSVAEAFTDWYLKGGEAMRYIE